jgi:hypothetical protein
VQEELKKKKKKKKKSMIVHVLACMHTDKSQKDYSERDHIQA